MYPEKLKAFAEQVTQENSEIGCQKIIKEVQREAIKNIAKEDSILNEIAKREKALQDGSDFRDLSRINSYDMVPEQLRPKNDGLTEAEFQVYKDYENIDNMIGDLLDDNAPTPQQTQLGAQPRTMEQEQLENLQIQFREFCKVYCINDGKFDDVDERMKKHTIALRDEITRLPD